MLRSKSTRTVSFWLSPIGFLGRFGRKSSETLDFPGKMRKRHAETAESSGKSRLGGRASGGYGAGLGPGRRPDGKGGDNPAVDQTQSRDGGAAGEGWLRWSTPGASVSV